MTDNPYAEFQQTPVTSEEEQRTRTQKNASTPALVSQNAAAGDPYAEFKKPAQTEEATTPKEGGGFSGMMEGADKGITSALAPNPENYSSILKTNAIEVPKTLGRELYQGGKTVLGMIPGAIESFTQPVTPEEGAQLGIKPGQENTVLNRLGAGLGRISGGMAMGKAAETYANPKTRPTVGQALEVLPEAIGEGAGNVVGFKGVEVGAPKAVKKLGNIDVPAVKEVVTAPIRGVAKAVNLAKEHPAAVGAVTGAVTGGPAGALTGGYTGGKIGAALKKIPNLPETFGKQKVKGLVGNEYAPKTTTPVPEAPTPSKLGRIEYAEPTEAAPLPERVGNEYIPESTGPKPEVKEPSSIGRIEYAEPTPNKSADLKGSNYTEAERGNLPEETKKHPLGRIEYAEPTPFDKSITPEEVKSSPGTSMAKEKPVETEVKPTEESPKESFEASKIIDDYNTTKGRAPVKTSEATIHPKGKDIADAYDAMKHDPTDPAVQKSYDSLKKDIDEQFDHAEKSGINFEPWNKEGQPYKNSKEMMEDVKNNKHLYFFQGGELPEGHPMSAVDPNTGYTFNDKFRAVHDLFGHAAHGLEFGPKGEEGAYHVHAQTLSPESIPALTTETRGQNNWVNFGKHMRNAAGEVMKKGEEGYIPPTERPFAEQKAGILPEEFHGTKEEAKSNGVDYSPQEVVDHIKSGKDFAVLQAENPQNTRISPEENAKLTQQLKDELIDKGYNPVEVGGNTKDVEGVKENAFFVPDITPADAAEIGRKYKQQGILTSEGLHDLNTDTVNPIKREQELLTGDKAREQQYFTTIGDQDFNVPLDFEKTVKPGETVKTQVAPKTTRKMSDEEAADFDHTITSNIPMGPTALNELRDVLSGYTDKTVKFLGAGNENTVFDLGNGKIAKIAKGDTPKVPNLPEVLQPEAQHKVPGATGEFQVSIYPKVETEGIPQSAITEMTKKLEKQGYKWDDAEGNIGRTEDGKYVVIDSGGLEKIAGEVKEPGLVGNEYKDEGVTPEEFHPEVEEQVANLSNDNLKKLGKEYGLNPEEYDFSKREALREGGSKHPVERHQFIKDLMEAMPDEEKTNIGRAVRDMKNEGTFQDVAKSSKGRAEAAQGVFPKLRSEVNMKAKGGAPEATTETAKLSNQELLDKGFTQEEIDNGKHLPKVGGAGAKGEEGVIPEEAGKHLTKDERAGLKTNQSQQTFVDKLTKLPSVQEFVDIAQQGEGGRKWYQRGTKAFDALSEEAPEYFKEGDRDKFIDLLASSSPQQTVAMNLKESLRTWKEYIDEGRPTGKQLDRLLRDNLALPDAKVPNAKKALAGEEMWPDLSKNSNFKVPSFGKNLKGWLSNVTNDGWMALFGGMKASELQRPTGYHPLSVATRAAAEELGWEPAEAQAAIWAFTKAFTEHGETEPGIIKQYSEDFVDIMQHDPEVRDMLQQLGVSHENLDAKLGAIGKKPEITGRTTPTTEDSIRKLGERVKAAGRELPKPKDQRSLDFTKEEPKTKPRDKDVEFNPEEFEVSDLGKKKSRLGTASKRK